MKLMIVDDHTESRALIRQVLAPFAVEICECASGEEAVQRTPEFRPQFVTMDLHMQSMGGLEATRRILALQPSAHVVVVTQSGNPLVRAAATKSGARRFILKDELDQLSEHLQRFIVSPDAGGDPTTNLR